MDPNETLRRIREIAQMDVRTWKARGHWTEVEELVEHFRALDSWLSSGGFFPDAWGRDLLREAVAAQLREGQVPKPTGSDVLHGLTVAYRDVHALLDEVPVPNFELSRTLDALARGLRAVGSSGAEALEEGP